MELNKGNMRKIRELILFTALLIVVLWKYEEVLVVLVLNSKLNTSKNKIKLQNKIKDRWNIMPS